MAPINFYYQNVQHSFNSVGKIHKPEWWNQFITWPQTKLVSLLKIVDLQRKKAWSAYFKCLKMLKDERKEALNFYYFFLAVENRKCEVVQINNPLICIILEKHGLRFNKEEVMSCGVCEKTMENIDNVSMVSECGHCMHTECIKSYQNEHKKCYICKKKIDTFQILPLIEVEFENVEEEKEVEDNEVPGGIKGIFVKMHDYIHENNY